MHPHRSSALGYASAASAAHNRVYGACAAEGTASETSGLSVGGCPRAYTDFGPYPVCFSCFLRFPAFHIPRYLCISAARPALFFFDVRDGCVRDGSVCFI